MFSYYYLISYCITYVVNFLKCIYIRLCIVSILLHGIVHFVILHYQHSSSDTAFLNAHLERWQQVPINRANKWAATLFLDKIIKDFWHQCTKDTNVGPTRKKETVLINRVSVNWHWIGILYHSNKGCTAFEMFFTTIMLDKKKKASRRMFWKIQILWKQNRVIQSG